jgi:hypothetical protein
MASVAVDLVERRGECRHSGGGPWQPATLIRPGQRVTLINICSRAALIESDARLRPGARTEMQLADAATRATVKGRLDRCYVAALEPLRYRGVLMFDQCVHLGELARGGRE